MVSCVHHIPGRARFKIAQIRSNPVLIEAIEREIGALEGVNAVVINRHAASIVVHYCTERGAIDLIHEQICRHCPKAETCEAPPAAAMRAARARPEAINALSEAAGKAVVATFITRTLELGLSGFART
ncbi:hypothetical protein SAMN04487972_102291 [Paracoccus halophilus]|uniref:Uncharacterized protein n=1 Tax=Paracoccus halophilus TaxID=376733 RepID=A0A1I0SSG2_9RHOB|nr:hypothetical protein [Paracoccus halophilus]SFA42343.1 hypothetical protein SAMN04487972_102291 [Paracoccus halophilus]